MRKKNNQTVIQLRTFINAYITEYGKSPSIRTISLGTGVARATVQRYLTAMDGTEDGTDFRYRNGRLSTDALEKMQDDTVPVALLGTVACGLPTYAEEHIEAYLRLPAALTGHGRCYLLRAYGDSMIDAGISPGDMILVRQQPTATAGQIAVILTGGEVTLKRYYPEPEKQRVRLHPENKEMEDFYVTDATVQGVALKVIKNLI